MILSMSICQPMVGYQDNGAEVAQLFDRLFWTVQCRTTLVCSVLRAGALIWRLF